MKIYSQKYTSISITRIAPLSLWMCKCTSPRYLYGRGPCLHLSPGLHHQRAGEAPALRTLNETALKIWCDDHKLLDSKLFSINLGKRTLRKVWVAQKGILSFVLLFSCEGDTVIHQERWGTVGWRTLFLWWIGCRMLFLPSDKMPTWTSPRLLSWEVRAQERALCWRTSWASKWGQVEWIETNPHKTRRLIC